MQNLMLAFPLIIFIDSFYYFHIIHSIWVSVRLYSRSTTFARRCNELASSSMSEIVSMIWRDRAGKSLASWIRASRVNEGALIHHTVRVSIRLSRVARHRPLFIALCSPKIVCQRTAWASAVRVRRPS